MSSPALPVSARKVRFESMGRGFLSPWHRLALCAAVALCSYGWFAAHRLWEGQSPTNVTKNSISSDFCDEIGMLVPRRAVFQIPETKTINGHAVLMMQPPASLEWLPPKGTRQLTFTFGFDPVSYEQGATNGADLILELVASGRRHEIFRRRLDPKKNPADRGSQNAIVPLSQPLERDARIIVRTEPGESGDAAWDWIYLATFHFDRG